MRMFACCFPEGILSVVVMAACEGVGGANYDAGLLGGLLGFSFCIVL